MEDAVTRAESAVAALHALTEEQNDLAELVEAWRRMEQVRRDLADLLVLMQDRIGEMMGDRRVVVAGVHLERAKRKRRRNWQSADLLKAVLATRRVDKETGEVEAVEDVLRACYDLGGYNARVTALRERGIDPDEFCEVETRGWTVKAA